MHIFSREGGATSCPPKKAKSCVYIALDNRAFAFDLAKGIRAESPAVGSPKNNSVSMQPTDLEPMLHPRINILTRLTGAGSRPF